MTLKPGVKLGPYEIVSPLGAGGMGEVYRARDTRLDRDVAVKVLPKQFAQDPTALSRFEREAKAVAALSHPNVLAVYDVGREEETSYVVTELLEGETLRQRLTAAPLPWRKAVEIGVSVADGLAAAHARGIVHRDLKPENIFLTTDGVVKILDFGLARMTPDSGGAGQDAAHTPTVTIETRPGTVIGTLNYMSPEQLRGLATDSRSDIFSFGCVLYEMVAGHRAFQGETSADTMTAILRETPVSVRAQTSDVGVELERVIDRCLEKKSEQRFHSASDLGFTLKSILADSGSVPTDTDAGRLWGFAIPVATAGLVLLAMGAWALVRSWPAKQEAEATRGEIRSIAVLPFDNLSNDPQQQVYVDAIWESITDDLAKLSAIQVSSSHTLRYYREQNLSPAEIEEKLDVDAFVTGSALHSGSRVDVGVRLVRASDGRQLWSNHYEFDRRDILTEQRKVAHAVASEIKIELSPAEKKALTSAPRIVPAAYDAYVQGMEQVRQGTEESLNEALRLFDQALVEDPQFALAHVGRARAYYYLANEYLPPSIAMPKLRDAALQALAIDDSLADAHVVLGLYELQYAWNWDAARDAFKQALKLSPSSAKAHLGLALYLSAMKRPAEAIQHLDIVHELDRASLYTDFDHGTVSFMARDYDRTIRDNKAAIAIDKNWWAAYTWLALAYSMRGEHDTAIEYAQKARELNDKPGNVAMMGGVFAVAGLRDEAKDIYAKLKLQESEDQYICPYELATIPLGLGDVDTAFSEMDRACEARADCLAWLQVDPRLDSIRDDPRFDKLLVRVGFEPRHGGVRVIENEQTEAKTTADRLMLAVLPFANLGRDAEQEYFSDGMTEETITALGRLNPTRLGVIARTSAMRFKNSTKPIDEIGRELGVDYVVEGSVRRGAGRVRITTKLVQVSDQTQLWSDSYERELAHVLQIQVDVADAVAQALALELLPQNGSGHHSSTGDSAAYDQYLLGRHYWAKRTPEDLARAMDHFKRAIQLDPDFALAHAGLADAWLVQPWYVEGPYQRMYTEARKAADRAIALDDSLAEGHVSMGGLLSDQGRFAEAESHFRRALALDPNNATLHQWYGLLLFLTERADQGVEHFETAISLDPLSAVIRDDYGGGLLMDRRYRLAIAQLEKALELNPRAINAANSLVWAHIGLGQHAEAAGVFAQYLAIGGESKSAIESFKTTNETSGLKSAFRAWLRTRDGSSDPTEIAGMISGLYAWCGETDRAFERLDYAVAIADPSVYLVPRHPAFDTLRNDPRYEDFLGRIGASRTSRAPQQQH